MLFLDFVAVMLRSPIIASVSVFLAILATLVFTPWQAFSAQPDADPDWLSIIDGWQSAARWWIRVSVVTVLAFLYTAIAKRSPVASKMIPVERSDAIRATADSTRKRNVL